MNDLLRHEGVRQLLDAHAAGSVGPLERRQIDQHLTRCADCRAELSAWQAIAQAVRQADTAPAADPAALQRVWARIHAASATVDATSSMDMGQPQGPAHRAVGAPATTPRRPATRRRPRLPLAVAAAGLLAAMVAGLLPRGAGGPAPAAAKALLAAADTAAARPAPPLGPGQFWYTKTRSRWVGLDTASHPTTGVARSYFVALQGMTSQRWLGLPNVQRFDTVVDEPVVVDRDRGAWVAAGRPRLDRPPNLTNDTGTLEGWQLLLDEQLGGFGAGLGKEFDLIRTLPTRPSALGAWLRERVRGDGPGQPGARWCPIGADACSTEVKVFRAAGALLAAPIAAPTLRAALYRVIAGLDGVQLEGPRTDEVGRHGTAVALTVAGVRDELLFDPGSATMLATRAVLVTAEAPSNPDPQWPRVPTGTTVETVLYLASKIVGAIGATN